MNGPTDENPKKFALPYDADLKFKSGRPLETCNISRWETQKPAAGSLTRFGDGGHLILKPGKSVSYRRRISGQDN